MLTKKPIFVNGFQRGGTNILVNLISSHHEVAWIAETHMVFYGDEWDFRPRKWLDRALYLPVLATTRQHIFWINKVEDRRPVPQLLRPYIDWRLYDRAQRAPDMKDPSKRNGHEPRPLFKNVNAMTLNTGLFAEMYPQAGFIGLVRNGLALCEGFIRRGWSAERFGKMYRQVCRQMIQDAQERPNYHIIRFEDLIAEPESGIREVYGCLGLDWERVQKYRLQAKKSMDKDGERRYMFGGATDREMHWFDLDELPGQFRTDVNANQIARLSPEDRQVCLDHIGEVMETFGYSV
jgi:hypothetical protein